MFGITDIVTYTLAVVVLILLPGPNSMFCMAVAGQYGVKTARRAIAGTFLGNGTLITASALGAGSLLKAYPFLFDGIKLAGGCYLAYIGLKLILGAWQNWHNGKPVEEIRIHSPHVFKKALTIALLNPKGLLFFPSMMVQFVDISYPHPLVSFLILGLIFQTVSLIYLNAMAPMADRISRWAAHYRKTGAAGKGGVGALFLAFAAKLWTAAAS
ncbi:leucine efflux protein LeuE [Neisseria animalis]|uniref:Leucine efflux protein LeuE n=1 Tax=Neisseria animalis TaxID=492 RepID=A0A5P3MR20_NEIAN|nr:leucine efflux protein LeuE [Neisseria animalis]QEY24024.1 leucine efflux protein LeuE [Neisseria animalis]ROW32592.1 leucine efflux protein LeuE [Neisseria animalis]VEE06104.1 Leucine efflux protein [Neisseria animalis]